MNQKFKTENFEDNILDVMEELKELFNFSPPEQIREHLLEVFFAYLIETEPNGYPYNHREIVEDYYFLILFLTKVEKLNINKTKKENTK